MILENKTAFDTRAIRSVLCMVHTINAPKMRTAYNATRSNGRLHSWDNYLTIVVRNSRKGDRASSGHAYLSGRHCVMSFAPEKLPLRRLIALWQHELWHLYGIQHGDYPASVMWCKEDAPFVDRIVAKFGDQFPLTDTSVVVGSKTFERSERLIPRAFVKPAKPKPTTEDKRAAKVVALVARRAKWDAKRRRADNAIAKIERTLRRHARDGAEVPALPKAASPKRRRRRK